MDNKTHIYESIADLPLCETIECAIDVLKWSDGRPLEYIIVDDKRIGHTESGSIPIRAPNTGNKMRHHT